MRMILGRVCTHALELLDADMDFLHADVVAEMGNAGFRHGSLYRVMGLTGWCELTHGMLPQYAPEGKRLRLGLIAVRRT
jgi:hypothetical protein